ncbi:hypothetical protein G7Y79_00020g048540 [Physcia stellaris]|nr:hypothetical protein G7Y79_00020g048540 [Physcia stellaris]
MDRLGTDVRGGQKAYLHDWINEQELESSSGNIQDTRADQCFTIKFYHCCLCVLRKLIQQLSMVDPVGNDSLCAVKCILQVELGRLYLCGEGFSNGEAADALEHSDDLRKNILEILCGIGSVLLHDIPRMLGDKMPSMEIVQDEDSNILTSLIEESKSLDVVDSISDIIGSDSDDNASFLSNDFDPCDDLRSLVQMVLDLVPSLEATIQHQKRIIHKRPYAPESEFQASGPAQIYISLVHDKFPLASEKLKQRLGEANWQRHLNIRRRMEQIENHQGQEPEQARNVNERSTNVGSIFQPQTLFHDSGIATTVASHSQFAQTEASHTSFISSLAEQEKGVTFSKIFSPIYVLSRIARTSFVNLQLARLGPIMNFTSISRSSEGSLAHLEDHHQQCFSESQISTAVSTAIKKIWKPVEQEECFLCNTFPCKTRRSLVAHIGKHMEEVALMALPRDGANDAKESSGSEDGSVMFVNNSGAAGYRTDNESGRCPFPKCGRFYKDLMTHLLIHQSERPEKCPVVTCEYHQKGFAREYDKARHFLTHYKGIWECGFCSGSRSATGSFYSRADVFKRHLVSVHGVVRTPSTPPYTVTSSVKMVSCFVCSEIQHNAQQFYEHLDECIIHRVKQEIAEEMLVKNGINPEQLSQDQLASFSAQNPQIQQKSVDIYTQNLAINPRQGMPGQGKEWRTPVAAACATGNLEHLIHEMKEHSHYLNEPDSVRRTPLQIAVIGGYVKIVQYLIEKGCVIDTQDFAGATPLTDAVENGNPEIVDLLLKAGANPRLPNGKGLEPLDLVIKDYANYEIIEKSLLAARERHSLRSHGEDLTAPDLESSIRKTKAKIEYLNRKFGNPPTAVKEELQEMLKVLVDLEAHENLENPSDRDIIPKTQQVFPDPIQSQAINSSDNAPRTVCDVTEEITPRDTLEETAELPHQCPQGISESNSVLELGNDAIGKPEADSGRSQNLSPHLEAPAPPPPPEKYKKPLKFKDAIGRKFKFPFHLCNTWIGMQDLIRQAFLHVEIIGPHVAEGNYDLVGPQGDIILPQVWETVVEPDWTITMHMWPMPEPAPPEAPLADSVVDVPPAPEVKPTKKSRNRKKDGEFSASWAAGAPKPKTTQGAKKPS